MSNPACMDYQRVAAAIRFLEEHATDQPGLAEVARAVHLSPHHFQRLFQRWAGVSPKRFLQFLTVEHAKRLLRDSGSVLDTTCRVGLSSPGRLHDLFVAVESVTPGSFKKSGAELRIGYGFHPSPFGEVLLAATDHGICHLSFVEPQRRRAALHELETDWNRATLEQDRTVTAGLMARVFGAPDSSAPLRLQLKGTNFQLKVWNALLKIPQGGAVSYGDLADRMGCSRSTRAVAAAVARNPVAWLIPCHRVLRGTGEFGGYRWGPQRKRAMLGWEAAQREQVPSRAS